MLSINGLHANFENIEIIKGIDLDIKAGEIHAIMGPNGSGKSTLVKVIAGHPAYRVTKGSITFFGKDILSMAPEARAHLGIFLAFQQPKEILGVNFRQYLHTIHRAKILNAAGKNLQEARKDKELRKEISPVHFRKRIEAMTPAVGIPHEFLERNVNAGFSGGEKKKSEILQLELIEPKIALLDELDSGLDVDSLKIVCSRILELNKKSNMSVLFITHYPRVLEHVPPDKVHLFVDGKILESGDMSLAARIEKKGYLVNKSA